MVRYVNRYSVTGAYLLRDKEIEAKRDNEGWSYNRLSDYYKMSKSSVYEAYWRAKGKPRVRKKLSTV